MKKITQIIEKLKAWMKEHPFRYQLTTLAKLMMETRKEGQILPPFWYGHAYNRWDMELSVYYPYPFNYLVQLGMAIKHKWDRHRSRWSWVDEQVLSAITQQETRVHERKMEVILREHNANMLLKYKVEKLELKDQDVLLIRTDENGIRTDVLDRIRILVQSINPNIKTMLIGKEIEIESLNEAKMNRTGWYSRKQVEHFEDKIEDFIKSFSSNTPNAVGDEILEQIEARRQKRINPKIKEEVQ
jgi:hypothetical protein